MDTIKVIQVTAGNVPQIVDMENTYDSFVKFIGGNLEALRIGDDLYCYLHEEGKFEGLTPTISLGNGDHIAGNAVFFRSAGGNEASLDEIQIAAILNWLEPKLLSV